MIFLKKYRLKKGWELFHKGFRDKAIRKTSSLTKDKNREICYEANRLCGISHYKLHQYTEAEIYFLQCAQQSNIRHDWYNLAMCFAHLAKMEESFRAFEKIKQGKIPSGYVHTTSHAEMILQYARLLSIKGEKEKAFQFINELKSLYAGTRKMNPQYLQSKGLPSFSIFLQTSKPILIENKVEVQKWIKHLASFLDQEGKQICQEFGTD